MTMIFSMNKIWRDLDLKFLSYFMLISCDLNFMSHWHTPSPCIKKLKGKNFSVFFNLLCQLLNVKYYRLLKFIVKSHNNLKKNKKNKRKP